MCSSIDSIIEGFRKISTSEQSKELNYDVNELLDDISMFGITNVLTDGELECKKLSENYSKLKVLRYLVQESDILFVPFIKFMEKIDEINQYYLKNINLDPDYYSSECDLSIRLDGESEHSTYIPVYDVQNLQNNVMVIRTDLESSLNVDNPVEKLEYVLNAYSAMMTIVENVSGKRYQPEVDSDFQRSFKKPRCN